LAVIFWITIKGLDLYTKHGETITIPPLIGLTVEQAEEILKNKNLRYVINDSSTYELGKMPYTILDQDPQPNSKAKEDRAIYISVNSKYPPKVTLPNLLDTDLKLVLEHLEKLKLIPGELIYEPDPEFNSRDIVLELRKPGIDTGMTIGTVVYQGDTVNLVVSDGEGDGMTIVPDLVGMALGDARMILQDFYLNVGIVTFDANVADSAAAVIYKQVPPGDEEVELRVGEFIDIWLSDQVKPIAPDSSGNEANEENEGN
jgi:beta-lactam-binding protein with PASTA domain